MSECVRILIVDPYEPWRLVVKLFLARCPEWQIVGEASDGVEGLQKTEELRPDLIILEVALPKLNGIEAAKSIRSIAPKSKILFVSVDLCAEIVEAAVKTGAHGYVVKSDAAVELLPAIKAVVNTTGLLAADLRTKTSSRIATSDNGKSRLQPEEKVTSSKRQCRYIIAI